MSRRGTTILRPGQSLGFTASEETPTHAGDGPSREAAAEGLPGHGAAAGGVITSTSEAKPNTEHPPKRQRRRHGRHLVQEGEDVEEETTVEGLELGGGIGAPAPAPDTAIVPSSTSTTDTGMSEAPPRPGRPKGPITRPAAQTWQGLRQFVETEGGVRMFIQNCVASANLDCRLDLTHIATHARNVEYNPRRFTGAIMRLREPRSTALIFSTGKIVITGINNEDHARVAAKKIVKILQRLGATARLAEFYIQNLVATGDVGFPIRLEGLANAAKAEASYEPELFPGLIYRLEDPRVVVLVFVSGKIVVTGAKKRSDLLRAVSNMVPTLSRYRKGVAGVEIRGIEGVGGTGGGAGGGTEDNHLLGYPADGDDDGGGGGGYGAVDDDYNMDYARDE